MRNELITTVKGRGDAGIIRRSRFAVLAPFTRSLRGRLAALLAASAAALFADAAICIWALSGWGGASLWFDAAAIVAVTLLALAGCGMLVI